MSNIGTGKRWWLWIALLGAAAWLAFYGDKTPPKNKVTIPVPMQSVESRKAVNSDTRNANQSNEQSVAELNLLIPRKILIPQRQTAASNETELFASGNWNPPPPPPVKQLPPAPPMAPALPFTFIGKKLEAGIWEVFLSRGEQSFVAKEGVTIDNTYRVEKILPPTLSLTYLPLGQSQNLPIGAPE